MGCPAAAKNQALRPLVGDHQTTVGAALDLEVGIVEQAASGGCRIHVLDLVTQSIGEGELGACEAALWL